MNQADLTDEQLRAAWQARRRADWPATYEDCMRNPVYECLVRLHAIHGERIVRRPAIEQALPPEAEFGRFEPVVRRPRARPTKTKPPRRTPRRDLPAAPAFDNKRAASGERDED